jgi:DNA-binding MarR family transcriptional regulator
MAMAFANREEFHRMLAAHGITDPQGVELPRLIKLVANAYETTLADFMRDENLSGPRFRLLLRLYMEEKQGSEAVSPTYLSQTQNVSKNTISALLRSLEEQGLIERSLDPDDRRQFNIRLSPAGRDLVQTVTPEHVTFLNRLISELDEAEQEQLVTLLVKLHRSVLTHGSLQPD